MRNHMACFIHFVSAMYSASVEESVYVVCFLLGLGNVCLSQPKEMSCCGFSIM